ncbi:MAG: hypothetical protein HZC37_22540 [Burkholderiales bacterium]|nr:hypothetical protein [Burkholderiales bacterium]
MNATPCTVPPSTEHPKSSIHRSLPTSGFTFFNAVRVLADLPTVWAIVRPGAVHWA